MTARRMCVEDHQGLVRTIAKRYVRACQHLAFDDLVSEGNIGLMKALERFDPARGVQFATFASYWIRHHVRRAVSDQDRTIRLPVHRCEKLYARGELTRERLASLDAPFTEDGGCLHDVLADEAESPEEIADQASREALARQALELLDGRERQIIEGRFWRGETLKQVGDAQPIAISRERVRQIESEALLSLREILQPPVTQQLQTINCMHRGSKSNA